MKNKYFYHSRISEAKFREKVFINIVKNCTKEQLLPITEGKVLEGSTIYSDGWKAYEGLILNGYKHYRVFHLMDCVTKPFIYT